MKNYTDVTFVLDRSGSMESIKSDTIGGFNRFVEDQKKVPGEMKLSLFQFDDQYECVFRDTLIADVKPLTDETYVPRGYTALLDAIGRTVNETGARFASLKEEDRPEKVILVIITDGLENASKEFTQSKIAEILKVQQEQFSWQVVYLGANQDAIFSAKMMNIQTANAMTYSSTKAGMSATMDCFSTNTKNYRSGDAVSMSWTPEDRKTQEDFLKKETP